MTGRFFDLDDADLCASTYPGDGKGAGQLCDLADGHDGDHSALTEVAMDYRRHLTWTASGPRGDVQVRQVTAENVVGLFRWIDAGKFHYGPCAADGPVEVDGITLFVDGGRQVARFGDSIVRDAAGKFSVRPAEVGVVTDDSR